MGRIGVKWKENKCLLCLTMPLPVPVPLCLSQLLLTHPSTRLCLCAHSHTSLPPLNLHKKRVYKNVGMCWCMILCTHARLHAHMYVRMYA